jgi:hypothetical protein
MTEASEGTTLLDLLLIQDLGNEIYQRLRGDTNISGRRALRLACKGLRDFVGGHHSMLAVKTLVVHAAQNPQLKEMSMQPAGGATRSAAVS